MRYRRNRLKDSVVIPVWVIALLPVSPVVFLLILHHLLEGFIDWYNKLATGKEINPPYLPTGEELRRMGLVKFACFFDWFLTREGIQHTNKDGL